MMRSLLDPSLLFTFSVMLVGAIGCGGGTTTTTSSGPGGGSATSTGAGGATGATGTSSGTSAATGTGGSVDPGGPIGEWTDAPGACPAGITRVDIDTSAKLASASRGEDAYAGDAPSTCYFLHDGVYAQSGTLMFMTKGGVPGGARRIFVGQSREGVVIHGRAAIDDGIGDITIENLTFDLTGYSENKSFNTLTLGTGKNVTVDHVTFTGDCKTGLQGGHIETNGTDGLLVESCLIEKFGNCGGGGHLDHGVYLAGGSNLVFRNNVIRQNSSRGIQMYTQGGQYGTLDKILVERNRITENGHADYEDGIVINGAGTGSISNVTIQHNIVDHNWYSGIRFVGGVQSGIVITRNTFAANGAGSSAAGRSEINLDDLGAAAGTAIAKNLFDVGNVLINDCYDAAALGFGFGDNFVHGVVPSGTKGNCVIPQTLGDPQLVDPAQGDFHAGNAAAAAYGAYSP
jgi:parallel beta helix pectate lyase-like protein